MQIQVGPFRYEVIASNEILYHPITGEACQGLAWPDDGRIKYYAKAPVARRWGHVCHEIGHLLKNDLDITGSRKIDEESFCNLVGLAMSMINLHDLIRLYVYVTTGIDAPSAMMMPNMPGPIPVVPITRYF